MALATILVAGRSHGTRLLQALGRASYGIYLSHVLVLGVVVRRVLGRPTEADFASPLWMLTMLVTWADVSRGRVCARTGNGARAGPADVRGRANRRRREADARVTR